MEWVVGFPRRWWSAGFLAILWGSVAFGLALNFLLGLNPMSVIGLAVYFGVAGTIALPGIFAYSFLTPSTARLGILPDGVIIEVGSPKYPQAGFRQGYRWADLRLRGRLLILPPLRPRTPRWVRLSAAQFARIAPRMPSSPAAQVPV